MKLEEIRDEQELLRTKLQAIEADPSLIDEEDADFVDTLVAKYDELETRRMNVVTKLEAIRTATTRPETTENGDGKPETFTQTYRNNRDPFENIDAIRHGLVPTSEAKSRVLDAIEMANRSQWCDFPDEAAENATRLVQRFQGTMANPSRDARDLAWHMLRTGTQEYYDDFRDYVADPTGMHTQRATTNVTGSLGFMLPFVLDPTIILSNSGSMNPYRQVSRVEPTTSNTWNGVTSAGVNAAFVGEATASTDASPTVSQLQITPQKAHAWVFGSYESLEDSDLGTQLPQLFADAKDRLEEANFATGAGTGVLPQGAVTGGTTGNTAAATAYAVADVYTLQGRLPARFRRSAAATWLGSLSYINRTRQFDTAGGSSFWANLGSDTPERLLGKPIYESTSMSTATATGSLVLLFGDMSQYVIVDRVGMSVLYNPMITAAATANLPTGEAGWYAFWRTGAKVAVATAIQVLRIQ
jgi:HK97 family phage major capsid protein